MRFANYPHYAIALLAVCLVGCSSVPETRIERPLSARPIVAPVSVDAGGGIFQPRTGLFLFEDRRPRSVGDVLSVRLVEKTEAKRKSETKDDRSATASLNVPTPTLLGKTPRMLGATTWDTGSSAVQQFKDNETNSNSVSGTITVTVVDVLPNGNLVVAGEKQVTVNSDTEYIRLAGVVNPMNITRDGLVDSTQLADVQFESKNSQTFDRSQLSSMMSRFFLTLLPF